MGVTGTTTTGGRSSIRTGGGEPEEDEPGGGSGGVEVGGKTEGSPSALVVAVLARVASAVSGVRGGRCWD